MANDAEAGAFERDVFRAEEREPAETGEQNAASRDVEGDIVRTMQKYRIAVCVALLWCAGAAASLEEMIEKWDPAGLPAK